MSYRQLGKQDRSRKEKSAWSLEISVEVSTDIVRIDEQLLEEECKERTKSRAALGSCLMLGEG